MHPSRLHTTRSLSLRALVLGALVASVLLLAMPHRASAATASDNFNRANGSLGANWTDMTVGGLAISNDAVVGTQAAGNSGDIYTGTTFGSDQFSQIEVTSTPIGGGQWIGPAVRAQNGGQDLYVGICLLNDGNPELELFKLLDGNWTELGSAYPTGTLAAGTILNLTVTGSTLSFSENGAVEITATDTSLTGGAPGIMAYSTATAGNWVGGDGTYSIGGTHSIGGTVSGLTGTAVLENNGVEDLSVSANGTFTFGSLVDQSAPYDVTVQTDPSDQACTVANGSGTVASANVTNVSVTCSSGAFAPQYASTDANNIEYYSFTSADDGDGPQTLRVLVPTHPAAGVAHNFLYVLPVEAGLGDVYGDGLETLAALDAEDQYNLTIIEPTFAIDPWYANNPNDANLQYETFMTADLEPWVRANLSTTGTEQNWLIGFSKSGLGAQDLILKHPDLFQLAASWDFPADMTSYDGLGLDPAANYGTNANFQTNYELTAAFLNTHQAPFLTNNRIWIGGYFYYQADVTDYDALLTSEGIAHTTDLSQSTAHNWGSGWVPEALAALYQDSTQISGSGSTDTISFNSQGGSAVANVSGLDGTTVTLPGAPTLAGYAFAGWFVATSGGSALTSPYTLAGSVTLYAQWIPNATDTISFNSQGGSAVADVSGLDGTTVTLPGVPILAGYAFAGWFVATSGGSALTSPYTLAGSVTLYAQWTPAPATAVLVPATGAALGGTNATLDASAAAGAGVAKVQFTLTGGFYSHAVIGTATSTVWGYYLGWNTTTSPGGTYTLQSLVTDYDGNTASSAPIKVTVDNTAPVTAVTIPVTGANLSGTNVVLDATASASDGVNITKVQFTVTGGSYAQTVIATGTPTLYGYLAEWNTTDVPNGAYTLQSLATDAAGNTASSAPIKVTVDNTAPVTAVTIPVTGANLSGTNVVLDATASASDGVNITKVQFTVTGGSYAQTVIATGTPTLYGYLAEWNTTDVPNGAYTLQSLATDAAGNTASSAPISVEVTN